MPSVRAGTAAISMNTSSHLSRWLSVTSKALSWMLGIVAALVLVVFIVWMTVPRLLNVEALIVLTGSMEPAMPVGSVAFVNKSGAESVKEGDIITFRHQEGARPVLITHRVVEVIQGENGRQFRTQGDANSVADDWVVSSDSVVGEVTTVIPYMGYVTDKVKGRNGFLALMAIPGALIIVGEVRKIRQELRTMRRKDSPA
jgi:signal peptidase I